MKNFIKTFICVALVACVLLGLTATAYAAPSMGSDPNDVQPRRGRATMGGISEAGYSADDPTHAKLGTDFYLYITYPKEPIRPPVVPGEPIPKTGDMGLDVTLLMYLALMFGVAYLLLNGYAKKAHA